MIAEGEINRLKELPEDYDVELFNFYYKSMTPLIRKLAKNIDPRRFNVSRDIIISYFYFINYKTIFFVKIFRSNFFKMVE